MVEDYERLINGKDCVIVGPAGYLYKSGLGEWIDSHDTVVRLNWAVPDHWKDPPPEVVKWDLGSRSDLLYRRLLKLGQKHLGESGELKVDDFVRAGIKHIVAVDNSLSTRNMQYFISQIGSKIPYSFGGSIRRHLRLEMQTSPLVGFIALKDVLNNSPKSVTFLGFDLYNTGYYPGYPGSEYRQSMSRQEGKMGHTHGQDQHLKWLANLARKDSRLVLDETAKDTLMINDISSVRNAAVLIPARLASTRFPRKALAEIKGVPMIVRVCQQVQLTGLDSYVVTDSEEIVKTVQHFGFAAKLAPTPLTGTDCVARAVAESRKIRGYKFIISVQGDEPLVDPKAILSVAREKAKYTDSVIGSMMPLDEEERERPNVVKVVASEGKLMYATRQPVPAAHYRQAGVYAFSKQELLSFSSTEGRLPSEEAEDIEILRFLELGYKVRMVEVKPWGPAVDLPEHIEQVEALL